MHEKNKKYLKHLNCNVSREDLCLEDALVGCRIILKRIRKT
jgi:hypothetical protein